MINENLQMSGKLKITVEKENGKTQVYMFKNLVVDAGLEYIRSRLIDTGTGGNTMEDQISHIGVGTDSTAAAAGQTQLVAQAGSRQTITNYQTTAHTIDFTATFAAGQSTGALVEAGLFNAAVAGTMICRSTFPIVTKEAGDTLTIQWTLTVSAGA